MLIGGGARGAVWQRTVARLSGRRVVVPEAEELVAWAPPPRRRPADRRAAAEWPAAGTPAAGADVEPPAEPDRRPSRESARRARPRSSCTSVAPDRLRRLVVESCVAASTQDSTTNRRRRSGATLVQLERGLGAPSGFG